MPDDAITGSPITPHKSSTPSRQAMRALVLGAYGLIGADAARALLRAGFDVTGVGRDRAIAMRVLPQVDWHICDLTKLDHAQWQALTKDVDVVINAAGALQDGGGTNLSAIHEDMPRALCAALAGSEVRVVQISAAGVSTEASTEFFRSKARGDAALIASDIDHVILRPTLVLGHAAYGGTALLRAAAALPLVDWQMMADSQVQTVALPDLSAAIVACAQGDIANGTIADLTEDQARPFPELVAQMRQWMGLPVPRIKLPMPQTLLRMLAKGADLLAPLGWQSPLRSTAIRTLADGISGDPTTWHAAGGAPCRPLHQTFLDHPATVQERWFARCYLLLPLIIGALSLFWLASGLIGLWQYSAAVTVLTSREVTESIAIVAVGLGSLLDITLGILVLWRRHVRRACIGMIALTLGYLATGTVMTPDLWLDPLGAFVKVFPAAVLALVPLALTENR